LPIAQNRLEQLEKSFLNLEEIFDRVISNETDYSLFSSSKFPRTKYTQIINMAQGCSKSQLSVIQLNCQGLCLSLTDVMTMCRQVQPDILGLCETFLTRKNDSLLDIPGTHRILYIEKKQDKEDWQSTQRVNTQFIHSLYI